MESMYVLGCFKFRAVVTLEYDVLCGHSTATLFLIISIYYVTQNIE